MARRDALEWHSVSLSVFCNHFRNTVSMGLLCNGGAKFRIVGDLPFHFVSAVDVDLAQAG